MKKILLSTLVLFIVLSCNTVSAQSIFGSAPTLQVDTSIMFSYYRSCNKKEMKLLKLGDSLVLKMEFKKALKVYKKLERKKPSKYLFKKLGDVSALNKKYKEAEQYYNKAISADKQYKVAYACKMAIYELQGDKKKMHKLLREMRKMFPDDISLIYSLIAFHTSNNQYEEVVMDIAELMKIGSESYNDINKNSLDDNELAEILKSISKSDMESSPELAEYLINKLLNKGGCYSSTIRNIVKQYPDNVIAAKLYIAKDRNCHKNKTSLDLLKMLEDKGAASEWQYWRFGISAAINKDWKASFDYYNKGIEKNDNLAWLFQNRGEVRNMLNDRKGAIKDMTKAISIVDNKARFYIRRGHIYAVQGKRSSSLKDYIKASELDDGFVAFRHICTGYMIERKADSALIYAEKAIFKKPLEKMGYLLKANACDRLKDYKGAIDSYEMILSIDKNDLSAIRGIVRIYTEKKDYSGAIAVIDDLGKNVRDRVQLMFLKSSVYTRMGKYEKAFECISKINTDESNNKGSRYNVKDRVLRELGWLSTRSRSSQLKKKIETYINSMGKDNPLVLVQKARMLERKGEYRKATSFYNQALVGAKREDSIMIMMRRLSCMERYLSVPQMIREYDKFIKVDTCENLLVGKSDYLFRKGMYAEGMAIVKDLMKNEGGRLYEVAIRSFFHFSNDIKECEKLYKELLEKVNAGKFENSIRRYSRIDAYKVHFMMSQAYEKNKDYEKTLSLIDTLVKIEKNMRFSPRGHFSMHDNRRSRIYKMMGDHQKWFDVRYREYKNSQSKFMLPNLLSECLRKGMVEEIMMLLDKHAKGNKKYEHYCWVDIFPLMKANKYKEAEKKFKEILAPYSKNYRMLDMIYCDLIDVSSGFKKEAYREFVKGLIGDIITPMRNKGYKF